MAGDGNDVVPTPQPNRRIFARPSRSSLNGLSVQIQNAVPACSLDCLYDFISTNYPPALYRKYESVPCLCTEETHSGFTLGEAALRCLVSSCSTISRTDFRVYSLCSEVSGALPNTHSTLAVTVTAAPNIATTSSPLPPPTSTLSFSYGLLSPLDSTMVNSPAQPTPSSSNTGGVETTTLSTSHGRPTSETLLPTVVVQGTALPSPTSAPMTSPTHNQIIGMSVAGAAVAVILIALAIFFFVRRRRCSPWRRKSQNDSFEIGGAMSEPLKPDLPVPALLSQVPRTPIGRYNQPIADHLPPVPKARDYHGRNNSPNSQRVTDAMEYVHSGHSTSATNSPATPNSASLLLANDTKRYDGMHSTDPCFRQGRNSPVSMLSEGLRRSQVQSRSWDTDNECKSPSLPRNDNSRAQSDERGSLAKAQSGSTSLLDLSRGNYNRGSPTSEQPLSTSPLLHHTVHSGPPPIRSACQGAAHNLASISSMISNDFVFSDANQAKYPAKPSRQGVQNTHSQLQRANSHGSSGSVTSIETLGSGEMNVSRIPQRIPTNLSPVKEYISPVLRHHDGREQPHRPAFRTDVRRLPCPIDHRLLSKYSRQSPVCDSSRSSKRRHSRGDSLLAKRRGEPFADRMEKSISVPSGNRSASEISVSGSLTVADDGQPVCVPPSKSRSSSSACEEFRESRRVHHPARKMREIEDLASPRELNMVPTRDGANLVLRFR